MAPSNVEVGAAGNSGAVQLFAREAKADTFRAERIPSTYTWEFGPKGQHRELGIAESNLFIMLSALGLSNSINGERLLHIGMPLIGMAQDGLSAFELACVDELSKIMRFSFDYMQRDGEGELDEKTWLLP